MPDVSLVLEQQAGGRSVFGRDLLRIKRIVRRVRLFRPAVAPIHCCDQAIGRSNSRLTPKPRGRRPSKAALTRGGARKARDKVIRIERSVLSSRAASNSMVWRESEVSSSSQRWASRMASMKKDRAFTHIGWIALDVSPSP